MKENHLQQPPSCRTNGKFHRATIFPSVHSLHVYSWSEYTKIKTLNKLDTSIIFFKMHYPHLCFRDICAFQRAAWSKLICFCPLPPNLNVGNLPCLHLYLAGIIKTLKETCSETAAEAVVHFPQDSLHILSMLIVIFITHTRPKINTSSRLFGPCLWEAASVQNFNHNHFYKPVCLYKLS